MKIQLVILFALIVCIGSIARAEIVYTSGHADLGVGFETVNGQSNLKLHIHAEGVLGLHGGGTLQPGEYDSSDMIIGVPGPSISRPAGSQWNFLAANEGASIWFLPQGSNSNKPFLGLGTEELVAANGWIGTTDLTWRFNSISTVSGQSSHFSLFQEELGSPVVFASSLAPTANNNEWKQAPFSHNHFNYAFTGEGVYDVSLTITGVNGALGTFTDTTTYRFATGSAIAAVPEPSSMALLGLTAIGFGAFRLRKRRTNSSSAQG